MTDTVEKVFWGWRTKFSRAADALRAQRCAGPRRVSEKRPRTFASALGRISTMELSKNQHLRDFWHRSIFDFFNTIDQHRKSRLQVDSRICGRSVFMKLIAPLVELILRMGS